MKPGFFETVATSLGFRIDAAKQVAVSIRILIQQSSLKPHFYCFIVTVRQMFANWETWVGLICQAVPHAKFECIRSQGPSSKLPFAIPSFGSTRGVHVATCRGRGGRLASESPIRVPAATRGQTWPHVGRIRAFSGGSAANRTALRRTHSSTAGSGSILGPSNGPHWPARCRLTAKSDFSETAA